jgi:lysophospholipase L1-like esterase
MPVLSAAEPASITLPCGLAISYEGRNLTLMPSEFYVNDVPFRVSESITLHVDEPPTVSISEDLSSKSVSDRIEQWEQSITKCSAVANPKFNKAILVKGTVNTLKDAKNGKIHANADLLPEQALDPSALSMADTRFAALLGLDMNALVSEGKNKVSYQARTGRIDTIIVDASGKFSILQGSPAPFAPNPPAVPAGATALFNVIVEPGTALIKSSDLVPITTGGAISIDKKNKAVMKPFTTAINDGNPVRVVFFGDSITCGGFAYDPAASFPNKLLSRLHKVYPKSQIGFVNMGIGGSNSSQRMDDFDKAIAQKPDLVIVEFVNDFKLPPATVESNYSAMVAKAKAAGVRLLVCTPHLPLPSYLNMKSWTEVSNSAFPRYLRNLAKQEDIGLADVSMRWENLKAEGLPPEVLLTDGVLHPNEYGHEIYAQELYACLSP